MGRCRWLYGALCGGGCISLCAGDEQEFHCILIFSPAMQCTMCRLQCNKIIINPTQSCTIYSNARWSTLMQRRTMFVNNNSYSAIVYIACQWCALISFYWNCLDWSKLYVFNSLLWCKKSKGAAHNEGVKMAPLLHEASSDWMWDWKGKGTKGGDIGFENFHSA